MSSTFTTEQGTLVVPTASIFAIEDVTRWHGPGQGQTIECQVSWIVGESDTRSQFVTGTARENFDRMREEELAMISAAAERQQRYERGLPILPVVRGKVARP